MVQLRKQRKTIQATNSSEGQTEENQNLLIHNQQLSSCCFFTLHYWKSCRKKWDVPKRRQNTPMMALSSTTLRSASSASSSPPATAKPLTAAISGLESSMRVGPFERRAQLKKNCKMHATHSLKLQERHDLVAWEL